MADVAVTVEWETTAGTWVAISADLLTAQVVRGRQRELERYQPGRATIRLNNDARAYDPTHTGNPLQGHLKPNKRVRLKAIYAGVTYPLFLGYVDRITQDREGPRRGVATVEMSDGMKILARAELPSSAYAVEVAADNPGAWWRLGEPAESTALFDAVGDADLAVEGTPTLGGAGLVARDAGTSMGITTPATGARLTRERPALTAFTAEFLYNSTAADVDGNLVGETDGTGAYGWAIEADASPNRIFAVVATTAGAASISDPTPIVDGQTYHVALVWTGTNLTLYVNGAAVASVAHAGTIPATTASNVLLGGYTLGATSADGAPGAYQELAIYDTALSAARVAAHADAVTTPWDGETPAARLTRIADLGGWPALLRSFDTGTVTLQPATLATSALEHAQKVAESELFGNLYVKADGTLVFEDRYKLVNQASVATLDDDTDYQSSAPVIADDSIRNRVTVSRADGVAQTVEDTASIAEFGPVSYTLDGLFHDSDEQSRGAAQLLVSEGAQPVERVDTLELTPYTAPAVLFPLALGLELTDQITVTETPQKTGAATSRQQVVEGIDHDLGPKSWRTRLSLSPALGGTVGFWQLGVAGHSELGQTTRLYL